MKNATLTTDFSGGTNLENLGAQLIRYGLAIVFIWIGILKFTTYEAEGIKPLVEHSPLLSWTYSLLSVTSFSGLLGFIEILIGILIVCRPFSPKASAIGSIGCHPNLCDNPDLYAVNAWSTTGRIWFPFPVCTSRAIFGQRCRVAWRIGLVGWRIISRFEGSG